MQMGPTPASSPCAHTGSVALGHGDFLMHWVPPGWAWKQQLWGPHTAPVQGLLQVLTGHTCPGPTGRKGPSPCFLSVEDCSAGCPCPAESPRHSVTVSPAGLGEPLLSHLWLL